MKVIAPQLSMILLLAGGGAAGAGADLGTIASQTTRFRIEQLADGLGVPFGLAFLPDGRLLIGDRVTARLNMLDPDSGGITAIAGVPPVYYVEEELEGGLLDVAVQADPRRGGWLYFCYALQGDGGSTTVVDRARLSGSQLVERQRIFAAQPVFESIGHYGCRLLLADGYLFITVGDRHQRDRAQDLMTHNGKIIRLHDDGAVPRDNPFVGRAGALPEIWSYGHRNPQGIVLHPETGALWIHEHGPRGGDEINIVLPGRNYGWPVISYGREYTGEPIGAGITHRQGMEQPVYYYTPSIAPSGMVFYTGEAFPAWRGSLFIGALALHHLNRVAFDDDGTIAGEERLLGDRNWRVRVIGQDARGLLYVGIDDGRLLRLQPLPVASD